MTLARASPRPRADRPGHFKDLGSHPAIPGILVTDRQLKRIAHRMNRSGRRAAPTLTYERFAPRGRGSLAGRMADNARFSFAPGAIACVVNATASAFQKREGMLRR